MVMGKRRRHAKQATMWVATQDLPRTAGHRFYARLNQIPDKHDFDGYVEELCQRFYADEVGRPGLPPGRYCRLLLIGYFEGLDAERANGDGLHEVVGDRLQSRTAHAAADWRRYTARLQGRDISRLERHSIAESASIHMGFRELAFTTGW
jgi:hypothetical protein